MRKFEFHFLRPLRFWFRRPSTGGLIHEGRMYQLGPFAFILRKK